MSTDGKHNLLSNGSLISSAAVKMCPVAVTCIHCTAANSLKSISIRSTLFTVVQPLFVRMHSFHMNC